MNERIGREAVGHEGTHEGYGYGIRNTEEDRMLEFAESAELISAKALFKKTD